MTFLGYGFRGASLIIVILIIFGLSPAADITDLPPFGRDTVLIWEIKNADMESNFVVRIAIFNPDRFIEWESENNQGTVFMPSRDIQEAKGYDSRSLFEGGVDRKSKKNTTLWLSRRIFEDLKSNGKAKCRLDGVGGAFNYLGQGSISIDVNGTPNELPAIKASDGRGSEFWFLDQEENPLMVKHIFRHYSQTLTVINTDRPNTLRWIKGSKLANPPK